MVLVSPELLLAGRVFAKALCDIAVNNLKGLFSRRMHGSQKLKTVGAAGS